jgi:hypothetical protein
MRWRASRPRTTPLLAAALATKRPLEGARGPATSRSLRSWPRGGYGRRAPEPAVGYRPALPLGDAGAECEDFVKPLLHLLTDCKLRMGTVARTAGQCLDRRRPRPGLDDGAA